MDLLIGGARSGKTALGERLAAASGRRVHVVVTATVTDDEMADRIARHRAARPTDWLTVEAPRDLTGALRGVPAHDCVLLDCLSLWVSNLLADGIDEEDLVARADAAAGLAAGRRAPTIVVTNEVGHGLVPMHPVGRAYRDVLGRVNAAWATVAERALLVVAGQVLELRHPDDVT